MSSPMKSGRPPSMADVAKIAGVSHQTVSRVLNNSGAVRTETRERILAAIDEIGYRRNELARALATRDSKMLSIVTTASPHFGPVSTLFAMQTAAWEAGYSVSLGAISNDSTNSVRTTLDKLMGVGPAGIIFIAPIKDVAEHLSKVNVSVPMLAVSAQWSPDSRLVHLGVDQRQGAIDAVDHLQDRGCRNIAYIAGPEDWLDATAREEGYKTALEEAGLEPDVVVRGDWSAESGYTAMKQIIKQGTADGVFAANDQMALGAIRAAHQSGLSIPDDIKIVGFDDEPWSGFLTPPLTTVRQDFAELGRNAMSVMSEMINGQEVENRLVLPKLVTRESTQAL